MLHRELLVHSVWPTFPETLLARRWPGVQSFFSRSLRAEGRSRHVTINKPTMTMCEGLN